MSAIGNKEVFSKNLTKYIDASGKSRIDICKELGVAYSTFSEWANGRKYPRIDKIELIANYFGIKKSDLIEEPKLKKIPYHAEGMELIPLVGKVAAGYNCHAEENITEYIRTDADSLKTGYDYFWLEVKGDSMEPTIQEGDLVLVQEQDTLDSDCFAVVIVDNEDGLVKKVSIDSGKVVLFSINPYYPPRTFEKEDMNRIRIVGKVVEVKRRLV